MVRWAGYCRHLHPIFLPDIPEDRPPEKGGCQLNLAKKRDEWEASGRPLKEDDTKDYAAFLIWETAIEEEEDPRPKVWLKAYGSTPRTT